jgi:hypothetical protein
MLHAATNVRHRDASIANLVRERYSVTCLQRSVPATTTLWRHHDNL